MDILAILIIVAGTAGLVLHAYSKGLMKGFKDGARVGFNDGVEKALKILQEPLHEKHGLDVVELFDRLMNDDDYMKRIFHVK